MKAKKEGIYLFYDDCTSCYGKGYITHTTAFFTTYHTQCVECVRREDSWKKTFPLFYRIQRKRWSIVVQQSLNKKTGKIVEKKVEKQPQKAWVRVCAEIDGKMEPVIIEWEKGIYPRYEKVFKTIELAQAWISEQGNIRDFWSGMKYSA